MKKQFRLKDDHPLFRRVDDVFALMEKNKISINTYGDMTVVIDSETGAEYNLRDLEDTEGRGLMSLPPMFEYKLTFEKEVKE